MRTAPKVSGRELRRTLKTQSETVEQGLVPAVRGLLANERLLIAKVQALEQRVADTATLMGRLRWLIGR